ncbi:meiotic recombination protein SPO11 [Cryptococcus bacillisporus CA1873]|uniref:DNA topoisomerase (ATP-hydrolyzing) n=1 Tax=Cryptococcus bacillisporus CA1873 TaxID=1296111 RepID=A0ABR5B344_CRYGA|nr:meiotic recombination protein SPO11 [Cryptococcus bacillisporus CA1873]|eukprot:KIR58006.1 meiotic recombination protein SPO11 [Cryptococcus gattii CA1873]
MPHTMPSLPQTLSFPSYHGSPAHHMDDKDADILLIEGENSDHRTDQSCSTEDSDRDSIQVDDGPGDEDHLIWALADDLDSDASIQNSEDNNEEVQEALFEQLVRRTEAMRNPAAHAASFYAQSEVSDDDENSFEIDEPYSESLIEDGIQVSDEGREKALNFLESIVLSFLEQISASVKTIVSHETSKAHRKRLNGLKTRRDYAAESDEEQEIDRSLEAGKIGVTISLKNRKSGSYQAVILPDSPLQRPGRQNSIMRMTCIMRVASTLHEAILDRNVITLRDVYYRDKQLFECQPVVDKIVDDLVATAGLKRRDFYVCASAKGLIASSSLVFRYRTGDEIVLSATRANLVDPAEKIDVIEAPNGLDWVLIVEKDAIFQSLCCAGFLQYERIGHGVLITGKGFPDLATRQILRLIVDTFPCVKIYALVDADPHGLKILSTYMYGSKANAYSNDYEDLPLRDRVQWLGLRASDWSDLRINYDDLIPLEQSDIQMAMSMLRDHQTLPDEWKRELSHMLHLRRKAEIEIITASSGSNDYVGSNGSGDGKGDRQPFSGVERLINYIVKNMAF